MSVCDSTCRPCIYHATVTGGMIVCDYLLVMGRRRGCEAGKNCRQRINGKKAPSLDSRLYRLPPNPERETGVPAAALRAPLRGTFPQGKARQWNPLLQGRLRRSPSGSGGRRSTRSAGRRKTGSGCRNISGSTGPGRRRRWRHEMLGLRHEDGMRGLQIHHRRESAPAEIRLSEVRGAYLHHREDRAL